MELSQQKINDIERRSGEQLEALAQYVDQWLIARTSINDDNTKGKFDAALNLLERVENLSKSKKKSLKSQVGRKPTVVRSTRRKDGEAPRKELATREDEGGDLLQCQDEINSWDLLQILSHLQYSRSRERGKTFYAQQNKPHRYSSDADLWTQFIFLEDSAREKKLVLEWLERCARDDQADIEAILGQFEERIGDGEGTWSHGWLHTREQIKSLKRLTSVKGATPVKEGSIRLTASSDLLVTQLDPDAPTRQGRKLEKDDENHDRAFWMVCYEMFRRGMPWSHILEWCEERNEGWRAASLGVAQDLDRKSNRLCLAGPYAGALWRRMCYKASQQLNADMYERATYGLLAGDISSVEPVCRSWTDWLYANYNSLLLGAFEDWLKQNHPERFPSIVSQKYALFDPIHHKSAAEAEFDDMDTTMRILGNQDFADAARESVHLLQGSFVAHSFDKFGANLGIAIAQKFRDEAPLLQPAPHDAQELDFYHRCAEDFETVRMAAHVCIIYQDLGFEVNRKLSPFMDNILLFYIHYLRRLRKYEAIPTYAKCISNEDVMNKALGRMLFDIGEESEQKRMVELMNHAELNLVAILTEQYIHACDDLGIGSENDQHVDRFKLVTPSSDKWAGWRVSEEFATPEIKKSWQIENNTVTLLSKEELRIVQSLLWFFKIQSTWDGAFAAITFVMQQLLRTGKIMVALAVTETVSVEAMSLHITPLYLNRAVNVFHSEDLELLDDDDSTLDIGRIANSQVDPESEEFQEKEMVELLKRQGLAAKEMQDLCQAVSALISIRLSEEVPGLSTQDTAQLLKDQLTDVRIKMKPLLHNFMNPLPNGVFDPDSISPTNQYIITEDMALDLLDIKRGYLPDIILAYNGAITFASEYLGPETLLKNLELANLLAEDENAALARTIVESGRMGDVVTGLALSQKRLISIQQDLAIREKGKKRGVVRKKKSGISVKKREWMGETLDLWDVSKAT